MATFTAFVDYFQQKSKMVDIADGEFTDEFSLFSITVDSTDIFDKSVYFAVEARHDLAARHLYSHSHSPGGASVLLHHISVQISVLLPLSTRWQALYT